MAQVCGKIFSDFLAQCEIGTGGIEQTILIGNRDDIDLNATTRDVTMTGIACTHKITALVMKTGTQMYKLEGLTGKRMINAGFTFNDGGSDAVNTFTHNIFGRAFNLDEATLCYVKGLGKGADLFAIIRDNNKGLLNVDEFKILGLDRGLKLSELAHNYNENNGTLPFTLSSKEPDLEPNPPYIWLETDNATTLAKWDAQVATP